MLVNSKGAPISTPLEVFIAFPVYREVPSQTLVSFVRTIEMLNAQHISYQCGILQGCSQVCNARNLLVKQFLETKATHLFWIDSDMVWQPEDFVRLLQAGVDCVNVGYVAKDTRFFRLNHGLGFCCVKRVVMEKLSAAAPMGTTLEGSFPQVFQYAPHLGIAGEDIEFYRAVKGIGYTPRRTEDVHLGHVGTYVYEEKP